MSTQLKLHRYFTGHLNGKTPYDAIDWEYRTPKISNASGEVIFEQHDVKMPADWSETATQIVASKYFYGKAGSKVRETGADQLISRIVNKITDSGIKLGYFSTETAAVFSDELAFLLLNQYVAFNSPVDFNFGCEHLEPEATAPSWHWVEGKGIVREHSGYKYPQGSACFIQSVEDSIEGVMNLAKNEALLFKFGSGTGSNFSALRSSIETVSGGGIASGPLSFMKILDAGASAVKSGGKTRRAAKMAILNADHPDILAFIQCKLDEERKAHALMRQGYDGSSGPDSEAYASIFYQNANNSVRVSNEFMHAYVDDREYDLHAVTDGRVIKKLRAREVMREIAEATWACGDPGMQFDDTINDWHTSKNTARINASNPCSEYMFLDNSACNLASFNLMKFLTEFGTFDQFRFCRAVDLMIIAMDIIVDASGYPTEEIARNSHDYRPLGLGYANLGSLLMALGLPYDSDGGRAYAAVITAIMTGQAYVMSALLASVLSPLESATGLPTGQSGACPGWFVNEEPFLNVIKMHGNSVKNIDRKHIPDDLYNAAFKTWATARTLGDRYGFRNAQATVLAPTGTIGFMMDCETTGIEPLIALVAYKKMVGGGFMKLVNPSIPKVLHDRGYSDDAVVRLLKYVQENGNFEGSELREADLPIFDTAFAAAGKTRSISYLGHIRMMEVTQPFLSGAISKTVNLPNHATVEDIENAYVESWRRGLKAVAIYRDGSKSNQVLVTSKNDTQANIAAEQDAEVVRLEAEIRRLTDELTAQQLVGSSNGKASTDGPPKAIRHRLPATRQAVNHKFSIAGHDGYLTVGLFPNGQPGEIFVKMAKEGSTMSGLMDSFAVAVSMALQYGMPLEALVDKLAHTSFEPSGWTGDEEIGFAKSIMDYLARWMKAQFLDAKQLPLFSVQAQGLSTTETPSLPVETGVISVPALTPASFHPLSTPDAPACPHCGSLTTRNGSCFKCANCGSTTGCS